MTYIEMPLNQARKCFPEFQKIFPVHIFCEDMPYICRIYSADGKARVEVGYRDDKWQIS